MSLKLYNIYETLILENNLNLLTEDGNTSDLLAAIEGKYNIWFKYRENDGSITDRYVQTYDMGLSKANNNMISAYQIGGKTNLSNKDSKPYGWKQFRLDKIVPGSIRKTDMKYHQPIDRLPSYTDSAKFNPTGNKNMKGKITKVNFNKNVNNDTNTTTSGLKPIEGNPK